MNIEEYLLQAAELVNNEDVPEETKAFFQGFISQTIDGIQRGAIKLEPLVRN